MKKLLITLCLVLLVSCSNEVPDDKLVERQGITYEVNSTKPFTGQSVKYWREIELSKDNELVGVENIRERISFKNGKPHGLSEFFHENGQFKKGINYKDGVFDGLYEEYYENGQIKTRGNYKNDKMDGVQEWFNKNGQLLEKIGYKHGEMDGPFETYHENGQLQSKGENMLSYSPDSTLSNPVLLYRMRFGTYKEFSRNGELIKHIYYSHDPDYPWRFEGSDGTRWLLGWGVGDQDYNENTKTGFRKGFDNKGQLNRRVYFDKGKPGLHEFYDENGKLNSSGHYKVYPENSGMAVHGLWEYFDERGKLTQRVNYKDGEEEGYYEWFDENGKLTERVNYKDDEREGYHEWFDKNGKLTERVNYKDDEREGYYEWFDENGKLTQRENVKTGKVELF